MMVRYHSLDDQSGEINEVLRDEVHGGYVLNGVKDRKIREVHSSFDSDESLNGAADR